MYSFSTSQASHRLAEKKDEVSWSEEVCDLNNDNASEKMQNAGNGLLARRTRCQACESKAQNKGQGDYSWSRASRLGCSLASQGWNRHFSFPSKQKDILSNPRLHQVLLAMLYTLNTTSKRSALTHFNMQPAASVKNQC